MVSKKKWIGYTFNVNEYILGHEIGQCVMVDLLLPQEKKRVLKDPRIGIKGTELPLMFYRIK